MRLAKLQALGNDFLIVDAAEERVSADPGGFARRACDRHTGAGADGCLFLTLPGQAEGPVGFRIFNADGGEAEISGNGLRCAAAWLFRRNGAGEVIFRTAVGLRRCDLIERTGETFRIRIELGEPRLASPAIPFDDGAAHERVIDRPLAVGREILSVTCVSMGNPHCSLFYERFPPRTERLRLGRRIESHPFFPRRTNVEFVRVIDRREIEVLFWERGVGETLSSGSGAAAAAVAAMLKGFIDRTAVVRTCLGRLDVDWGPDGIVRQSGPVETVFSGEYLG